jgi:hypothetical protein
MEPPPDPIPPGIVRVSVCFGAWLYSADVDVGRLGECLEEFEEYVWRAVHADLPVMRGTLRGAECASSVAARAAGVRDEPGMVRIVCAAGLWRAVHHAGLRPEMERLIAEDGSAWCLCGTDEHGIEWTCSMEPAALARYGEAAMPWMYQVQFVTVH